VHVFLILALQVAVQQSNTLRKEFRASISQYDSEMLDENQPFLPTLAQAGKIQEGQNSDLVKCMERLVEKKIDAP